MGKIRRGALWALFPPAGAVASVRAGTQKRHEETLGAIREGQRPPVPSNPDAVREIAERLKAEVPNGRQRLKMTTVAMEFVHQGATVDEALRAVRGDPPEPSVDEQAADADNRYPQGYR